MIDASIPLNIRPAVIPDQVSGLAQIMQLIGAQQNVRLGDLQFQKLQKDMADEDATKTAYAAYLRDPTAVSLAELGQKNPKLVQDILKQQREAAKDQADITLKRAQARLEEAKAAAADLQMHSQIISGARDQATYELARVAAEKAKPGSASDWPERFDPVWVDQYKKQGVPYEKQVELAIKQRDQEWKEAAKVVDQRIAQQNADSTRISAGAAVTSAGAAVANARTNAARETREATAPKLRYDPELRVLVDERTGSTRPVTDASGAPLGTKLGSAQQEALQDVERTLSSTKKIKDSFKPEYVGLKGTGGEFNDKWTSQFAAPIGLDKVVSDPARVAFRAQVADLENQYIKSISGASVPTSEVPRLRRAIPTTSDSPAQFQAKLEMMEKNLKELPDIIRRAGQKTATGASAAAPPNPADFGLKPASR